MRSVGRAYHCSAYSCSSCPGGGNFFSFF